MPINAQELVAPAWGGDPVDSLHNLANTLYIRNMQRQRIELAKEGRRQQSGNFLKDYLNPKDYLTGSAYDPVIVSKLNAALQQGSQLAEQGADIPTMIMHMAPLTAEINQYSSKAKAIDKQIEDGVKGLRDSGYKGYDYQKIVSLAKLKAFHGIDPKTGAYNTDLANINNVDPSTDYVSQVLKEHPDIVTNASDFDEYAKNAALVNHDIDKTNYTPQGQMSRQKVNMKSQAYMVPEYDEKGMAKEVVPRYETATEGGEPLTHTFKDGNGNDVEAPVRLLDRQVFNDLVERKGVGDFLRGQVMKHLRDYHDAGGKPIDMDSPQAENVARAIAYDELKARKAGGITELEINKKPSAAQVNLNVLGTTEQRAYDRGFGGQAGRADAMDAGYVTTKRGDPKSNTVDALHEVATNNPEYLQGEPTEKEGRAVVEVSTMLPKAQLKFGPGKRDVYKGVFYDPKDHVFLLQKPPDKNNKEGAFEPPIAQKDIEPFLHRVAQANGVQNDYVGKSLQKYGYAKGAYSSVGDAPDLAKGIADDRSKEIDEKLGAPTETARKSALRNIRVKDGTVVDYGERGSVRQWGGASPYYLTIRNKAGKEEDKNFKSKGELEDYLKATTIQSPTKQTTAPTSPPAGGNKKGSLNDL